MADLDSTRKITEQQDAQETQKNKSNTRTKLATLAMGAIISGTQVQANDLLAQCDYNNNGIIDGRTYLKGLKKDLKADGNYSEEDKNIYKVALKNAKKERACKTKIVEQETAQMKQETAQMKQETAQMKQETAQMKQETAQMKQETAQMKQETAQMKAYLAQLDMSVDNLKKELKKVEAELRKNKAELRKNKAELRKINEDLERKKQWLIKTIKEMAGRA